MEKMWYKKPAHFWHQALPIGNGYTGVMIYGGKSREKLSFNDCTLWSGYPKDQDNPQSLEYLDKVRRLIFSGENKAADELCMEKLSGAYCEAYLPLGDVLIKFGGAAGGKYRRELDLKHAVHTVSYGNVTREAFASYPQKVVAYHIESEKSINLIVKASSKLNYEVSLDNALNLTGNAPDYVAPNYLRNERHPVKYNEGKGMAFALRIEAQSDGKITYTTNSIIISGATDVTLYAATATGFISFDKFPDTSRRNVLEKCRRILHSALKDYKTLKAEHICNFNAVYGNQTLSLGEESDISTDKLVAMAKKGNAPTALSELFYHFGKYLTVSGTREGTQALNLQGIWNKKVRPAWSSNYTANINVQMNYWAVVRSGMAKCIEPYVNLIYEIMEHGRKTAAVNYGCRGFACNHNVDIWRKTAPVQGPPSYMFEPLCGVWLANELYSHYKNGKLEQYRDRVLETVKEAALFANDYLVKHDGCYVTCPSASPEAEFIVSNQKCCLDYAGAFEMGIVKQCFNNYLEEFDDELAKEITEKIPKLYPFKCGDTGILEWHKDYEIAEKGHRHFSPLYSFYPGNVLSYNKNPDETQWIEQLFNYRLDNSKRSIGWSAAWAVGIAARLHNGEQALDLINGMLAKSIFKNLFDIHPLFIFQLDGNLGYVAGVNEMLLFEEDGVIELLPACPLQWKKGRVSNMVVNGAEISFEWADGEIIQIASNSPVKVKKARFSDNIKLMSDIEVV